MEDTVLERLSVRQFMRTLSGDEYACVLALYIGFPQNFIAEVFGMSPATLNRMVQTIRRKFTDWNRF